MSTLKGKGILDDKRARMGLGVMLIIAGILVALFEAVVPIFELKGIFSFLVALPFVSIGVTLCYRAGNMRPAEVMRLARELNGAVTPEWVVTTFDCKPSEAEAILNQLRDAGLIRLTQEGIDDGRMIFEVCLEDDPRGAARARVRQQDQYPQRPRRRQ